jgi:hypothetical protein
MHYNYLSRYQKTAEKKGARKHPFSMAESTSKATTQDLCRSP